MPKARPERSQVSAALMRLGDGAGRIFATGRGSRAWFRPPRIRTNSKAASASYVAADQRVRALPRQRQPARRSRAEAEDAVPGRHLIRVDRREVDPVACPGARCVESNNAPTSPHFLPASPWSFESPCAGRGVRVQTFLSGCRNPGDRDSGETAFRRVPVCPRPGARRARSVTAIRAPALQARAEAWPTAAIVRACPGGTCPLGPPPTPIATRPRPSQRRRSGSRVRQSRPGRALPQPRVWRFGSRKKYALQMLVSSTLLNTVACPAETATRPPCPADGGRAAQGRPKLTPAGFFSRLFQTLRGYPHIAPRPIRITN